MVAQIVWGSKRLWIIWLSMSSWPAAIWKITEEVKRLQSAFGICICICSQEDYFRQCTLVESWSLPQGTQTFARLLWKNSLHQRSKVTAEEECVFPLHGILSNHLSRIIRGWSGNKGWHSSLGHTILKEQFCNYIHLKFKLPAKEQSTRGWGGSLSSFVWKVGERALSSLTLRRVPSWRLRVRGKTVICRNTKITWFKKKHKTLMGQSYQVLMQEHSQEGAP